ncbi:hypothetical protein [Pelagibacterium luteolum]|uniref:Uncharacterized protein n=1 Tax=Pelagibacterium luteolum TaxID=440168 RepID=A0A1G7W0T4_9HYPH|nr:hypothetical protein [Pelagibacterium luteolum]SDG65644.1 hypothetical protein SAMN04487974_105137 [Pelagibacterium luteolum]
MNRGKFSASLAVAALLVTTGTAVAQPQNKLVSRLDKALIQAIWCSALLFEESFVYEAETDDAIRYENLSFDLGADIDAMLLEDGMRQAEVDEIWSVFDGEAMDLALMDSASFAAQLAVCETNYDSLL